MNIPERKVINLDKKTLKPVGEDDLNKSLFSYKEEDTTEKGIYNKENLSRINKGLQAGYGITPDSQNDGASLRPESLDRQIKQVTWGTEDFTIYNDIARTPANQTIVKYIVYYNHGDVGHRRFQQEIGLGNQTNPNLGQKTVNMKFLAAPFQTSMVLQTIDTVEDPVAIQEMAAINVLAKTVEWAIFHGDASLSKDSEGQNSGLEFDGLDRLIDPMNAIDRRGKGLTPALLNQAAVKIGKNGYGVATDAYMPIGVKADFINKYLGAQRVLLPTQEGMQAGLTIDSFRSARGNIKLNGSTIMDIDNVLDEDVKPRPGAPLAPSLEAAAVEAQGGKFLDKDIQAHDGHTVIPAEVKKDLSYKAVAVGKEDSVPSDAVKAQVAAKDGGIKLTVTIDPMSQEAPDYVAIYRQSLVEGNDSYQLIARIPASKMTADGKITFTDIDETIPGTTDVYVGEMNPQVINLFELLPMTKLNLATVTNATQAAVLFQGALRLSYPRRFVHIRNVAYSDGLDATSFGSN